MASTSYYKSDSDSEREQTREAKKIKFQNANRRENRPQKYRGQWESIPDFKGWLKPVQGKPLQAKCDACAKEFKADLTILKNHSKGAKHLKNIKKISKTPHIAAMFSKKTEAKDEVSKAEIKIAAFVTEHNLPMKICDHLIPLLKGIFPDSKIAQEMQMGRTKVTGVIKDVLAKSQFSRTN